MPTYEYQCEKCHKTFDFFQSMTAERLTTCPKEQCRCKDGWGKGTVKRLLGTGSGIIFKGSGFYCTDYRSNGYRESAKKDSAVVSVSSPESKPAESKPAKPAGGVTPPPAAS